MAQLSCPACTEWLANVDDVSWRVRDKSVDVVVEVDLVTSSDLWAELDVVEKRADEWRDRGVYDPMPPPADPVNSAVTLRCRCGESTRFDRP
jgi:hypothetical protein